MQSFLAFVFSLDQDPARGPFLKDHILIVYYSNVYSSRVRMGTEGYPYFITNEDCPVKCELSSDKSRAHEADALVTHCRNTHQAPSREEFPNKTFMIHCNECPVGEPALRDATIMGKFNFLISYQLDMSDFPCPQIWKPSLLPPVKFRHKWGLVFWANSNCEKPRTAYIHNLMRYLKIDAYGRCLNNNDRGIGSRGGFIYRNWEYAR